MKAQAMGDIGLPIWNVMQVKNLEGGMQSCGVRLRRSFTQNVLWLTVALKQQKGVPVGREFTVFWYYHIKKRR